MFVMQPESCSTDSTEIIKKTINENKAKKVEFASKKQKSQAKARITATLYLTSVTNTRTTFSSQQEDSNHSQQP
ncbi:hypothetical protein DY000_02059902 [Brassica cretica]|uniref:Remorin C-terminal domain-containing protein n=1 Tax=Brassica cretica TaxID=69181 RepID=A0ABQ7B193_BRACR|nr:hypothetical protein DY000_02059902 [Brassica cretica]